MACARADITQCKVKSDTLGKPYLSRFLVRQMAPFVT